MVAAAPSFADACGGANNLDPATCERLDYLVQSLPALSGALWAIVGAVAGLFVMWVIWHFFFGTAR